MTAQARSLASVAAARPFDDACQSTASKKWKRAESAKAGYFRKIYASQIQGSNCSTAAMVAHEKKIISYGNAYTIPEHASSRQRRRFAESRPAFMRAKKKHSDPESYQQLAPSHCRLLLDEDN
jgi:hypothetical protein